MAAPKVLDTVKVVELIDLPKSKSEPFLGQTIAPTEVIDRQITGLASQLKKIVVPKIRHPSDEELKNAAAEEVKEHPRSSARKLYSARKPRQSSSSARKKK